ncbi:hypothetical protein QP162_20855, partial [Sphingomonas aurantiaca]|uniref:hypothetical protein n=1 Tax=Sphingomonas aurantiaca TaxID=185949 RepID=UPI002FDF46C4
MILEFPFYVDFDDVGPVIAIFDREDLDRARQIALQKVDSVNINSPGGSPRTREVRLRRLVAGKLADHAVKEVLERYFRRFARNWSVEEFDEVRQDNFLYPDPWDLRCFDQEEHVRLVEVRSSFVHWLKEIDTLRKLPKQSLLGPYATSSKIAEAQKDLFWQVAFFNIPDDERSGSGNASFFGDHRDGTIQAVVMGGGERDLFERTGTVQREIAEGAAYLTIRPMSAGRTVDQMLRLTIGQSAV